MKRLVLLLIALMLQGQSFYAQDTGSYEYVRVPESFSFLKEPNQYQLNALAAFLFEKYGFNALYRKSAPNNVSACDILHGDVENDSGLFVTRLRVVLRNCADEVVFTSKEGKSREKDYKTAYHEALRDAFESLEDVQLDNRNLSSSSENMAVVEDQTKNATAMGSQPEARRGGNVLEDVTTYTNGSTLYRLQKTKSGFELYKEGEDSPFATLLKSATGDHFIYTSEQTQGTALFDKEQNLIVEYLDRNSGQLLNLKYNIRH